jgi:glutamine amidotransferase
MIHAIKEFAASGKPIFGICLGMQLLFESSEEFGRNEGLGLIKGYVKAFDTSKFSEPLKVPHMGWNRMFTKKHPLFEGLDENHYLYFVHTFHVTCENKDDIIGETEYGYRFTSAVAHNNIMGIQPHPEKSHENGLKILENFIKL